MIDKEVKFPNGFHVIINPDTKDKELFDTFKGIGEVMYSYMTVKDKRCYLVHFEHVLTAPGSPRPNFAPCYEEDIILAPDPRDEINPEYDEYLTTDLKKAKEMYGV